MTFDVRRRPSSWFGPQFSLSSFPSTMFGSNPSPRGSFTRPSISEARRPSNLKYSMPAPSLSMEMPEPLFQDSYLLDTSSSESISPTTPDPALSCLWGEEYKSAYTDFIVPNEMLEEVGITLEDDDTSVVATFVSIRNLGKPKVVEIRSPTLSRQNSPRHSPKASTRPPIVWRMPSYESATAFSEASYPPSERTESIDSLSTYPSSYSEGPKTPGSSFPGEHFLHSPFGSLSDPSSFPEPRHSLSRSSTQMLRRSSRNLSQSFSKAFLTRLKDAPDMSDPRPVTANRPYASESPMNFSLPYSALQRPSTSQSYGTKDELYSSSKPQHISQLARVKEPELKRKKSLATLWL